LKEVTAAVTKRVGAK
jgi:hypothetical protein